MRISLKDLERYKERSCLRMVNLRRDHDYTQEYVANQLGIRQNVYARYENGHHDLPVRHLIALCKLYHVSADYIIGISNRK